MGTLHKEQGAFLGHASCFKCGSSDALALYDKSTGVDGYCNSCGKYHTPKDIEQQGRAQEERKVESKTYDKWYVDFSEAKELPIAEGIPHRGIRKEVCEHYGVRVQYSPEDGEPLAYYYPRYDGKYLTGFKAKHAREKKFTAIGDCKDVEWFGKPQAGDRGQMLIITEGEDDTLAAYQITLDYKRAVAEKKGNTSPTTGYRVVSLPDGADRKGKLGSSIMSRYEWLEGFDTLVLNLDMDRAGESTAESMAEWAPCREIKIVEMPLKDANDMLKGGKKGEYIKCIQDAKPFKPTKILSWADTKEMVTRDRKEEYVPFPWECLNRKLYGSKYGSHTLWCAGTSAGKSTILRSMALHYHKLGIKDEPIGLLFCEEEPEETVSYLVGLHMNKNIENPLITEEVSNEEKLKAWEELRELGETVIVDISPGAEVQDVINQIKYAHKTKGCRIFIFDHFHKITGTNDFDKQAELSKELDVVARKFGLILHVVVHLKKTSPHDLSFEQGRIPTEDDISGLKQMAQEAHATIGIARNKYADDEETRNTTGLFVLKARKAGETGFAGCLEYVKETGQLIESNKVYVEPKKGE
jgi:twinkle protein